MYSLIFQRLLLPFAIEKFRLNFKQQYLWW